MSNMETYSMAVDYKGRPLSVLIVMHPRSSKSDSDTWEDRYEPARAMGTKAALELMNPHNPAAGERPVIGVPSIRSHQGYTAAVVVAGNNLDFSRDMAPLRADAQQALAKWLSRERIKETIQ